MIDDATPAPPKKKPRKKRAKKTPAPTGVFGLKNPYVLRGLAWARAVVAGELVFCKEVRQACARQLRDLERWHTDPTYPYRFDEERAARKCEFLEQLPHTQGPLAFELPEGGWNKLALEPWQCFIETTVYGWYVKASPKQRPVRRFTRVYEEEPRGQGKSLRLSGGLLYAFTEGEQGVEAFSAAVDRDQAMKVYGEAVAMIEKEPELAAAVGLQVSAVTISQPGSHSFAKALSREAKKTGDGKNIYFAAVDELHAHITRAVWDVLDSGTGKRGGNALIWIITTAGFDTAGVCFEKRRYVQKILDGTVEDETWFGIIFTIDAEDDWADTECRDACLDHSFKGCVWRKANPNWGVSVDPVDFESKMKRALQVISEQNGILTKHLNIWCNADVQWMDMRAYDKCADPALREEDFAGAECVLALDLASKTDLCAKAKIFRRDVAKGVKEDGTPDLEPHFYGFVRFFLPEGAAVESRNAQYPGWVREGHIVTSEGDTLGDYEATRLDVERDASLHRVTSLGFDPWQAGPLVAGFQRKGMLCVEKQPTVKNFSEPMKTWEALVLEGRWHHDGNPVMRWNVSNVVCHRDAKDNIYPRKEKPENKIDGAVANIMALAEALATVGGESASIYETRGILVI